MLRLPDITLCCIDTRNHALAVRALAKSRRAIEFARTVFFTDAIPVHVQVPQDLEIVRVDPITSHAHYSKLVLKGLCPHIETSHALVIQWDGYVVHPDAWEEAFLQCDYLGAPWSTGQVGNGGFSLRSRKLLEALQDESFPLVSSSEDVAVCSYHRPRLEAEFGIRFGNSDMARRFSFETDPSDVLRGAKTFGFHGVFNFFLTEDQGEIAQVASLFSDSNARFEMTVLLLRNLLLFGQFEAALAVGARIVQADPDHLEAAEAVVRAREHLAARRSSQSHRTQSFTSRFLTKLGLR